MRKLRSSLLSPLLFLKDGDASQALWKRVYLGIRHCIENQTLPSGAELPSTRQLADELRFSRNTVINAYEQLKAEGYLESRRGSGTYVAALFPEVPEKRKLGKNQQPTASLPDLSHRGKTFEKLPVTFNRHDISPRPFQHNLPAMEAFPFEIWKRLIRRRINTGSHRLFLYGDPAGYLPLREALHQYLTQARGISCTPDEIIITNGSQQSLDVINKVVFDWGESVIFEDPGHPGAKAAFSANGVRILPATLDGGGLMVAECKKLVKDAKAIYVTPSHQYPSGVTMPLERRLELLNFANENNLWIIEDDEDSEFRYASAPLPALRALPFSERVIYLGSFSKKLFPGLRLGYLIVPAEFKDTFVKAKSSIDRQSPQFEQAVLADFIAEGHFSRHIKRMRKLYSQRLSAMLGELDGNLPAGFTARNTEAGMHLVIKFPAGFDDASISSSLHQIGIEAPALSKYCETAADRGLLIGFAGYREEVIKTEIKRLLNLIKNAAAER